MRPVDEPGERLRGLFHGLADVVTPGTAHLRGQWTVAHEPSHPAVKHCEWTGMFEFDDAVAGMLMLHRPGVLEWRKTPPRYLWRGAHLAVRLRGWIPWRPMALAEVRFHGATNGAILESIEEPPASCTIREGDVPMGVPHRVFALPELTCAVLLLRNGDVRSSVDRTWRLHESLAAKLPAPLARWMTRRPRGSLRLDAPA